MHVSKKYATADVRMRKWLFTSLPEMPSPGWHLGLNFLVLISLVAALLANVNWYSSGTWSALESTPGVMLTYVSRASPFNAGTAFLAMIFTCSYKLIQNRCHRICMRNAELEGVYCVGNDVHTVTVASSRAARICTVAADIVADPASFTLVYMICHILSIYAT